MQRPFWFGNPGRTDHRWLVAGLLVSATLVQGQVLMLAGPNGHVNIFNTDLAVFESGEVRKDLACTVTPSKPVLGFDLRFHAGYDVTIPLKELAGSENSLNILFRVSPQNHPDQPIYFTQHIRVPRLEDEAKGDAFLQGGFDLGEGNYHADWLMRDRSERVCSFSWDSEATLAAKDRSINLAIGPGEIQRTDREQFKEEPPVQRVSNEPPLNVKVLVNFAPQDSASAALQPVDTSALVSILRSISREPRIGKFSIVAFNMQEERVVYRQEGADRIDFPALGEAINSLNLGTVDLKRLSEKHGDTDFLAGLVRREVGSSKSHPDALIFAGPKVMLDSNVPPDALKEAGEVNFPVFYMNYNLNPQAVPWKDAISHTVHFFRGYEYTITHPRDLWFAVSEMVSRIVKSRNGKQTSSISTQ
ncbi:MAG TPA: acetyltransferase [Bryobacteraceae bacterium]|nr:acetyltransferase [Bryobacteraceae bacterium]